MSTLFKTVLLLTLFALPGAQGATVPSSQGPMKLSLKQTIDLALKQNLDFAQVKLQLESDTINYNTAWRSFYLPSVNLVATSASSLTLGAYPGTPSKGYLSDTRNTGYPSSAIGIAMGNYTLFNFFRDRIAFDIAKLQFERANQIYEESKRSFTIGVISSYFQARLSQEKLDASERSLQIADLILRLVKSRMALKLSDPTELDSAEVDRNDAVLQVTDLKREFQNSLLNLNLLLNQNVETPLNLTTELEYKPANLSFEQAYNCFKERSPGIRSAKLFFEQGQGNVEIAEKNRMPLPTVTFSGLTVAYGNNYGAGSTNYGSTNGQIDVQAAINLTLPIFGPGGLFNQDAVRSTHINLERAELGVKKTLIEGEVQIRTALGELKQLQDRLKPLKDSFESSAKLLDRIVSQMSTKKESRLELRDALKAARNNEIALLENVFNYTTRRNDFYRLIGRELEIE